VETGILDLIYISKLHFSRTRFLLKEGKGQSSNKEVRKKKERLEVYIF